GGDQQIALKGSPTGGTFTLSYGAATTVGIPYNATAAVVQLALGSLPTIGFANVTVSGPDSGPWQVHLAGSLALTGLGGSGAGLTGGSSPSVAIGTGLVTGGFEGTIASTGDVSQWSQVGTVWASGSYVPPEFTTHFAAVADPTQSGIFYVGTFQGNLFRL